MRVASIAVLGLSALSASGCGVRFVSLNAPPHALVPRPPESVEVYAAGPPARPHVDVGMISLFAASAADYVRDIREEGARLGCDAVVMGLRYSTCVVYQ